MAFPEIASAHRRPALSGDVSWRPTRRQTSCNAAFVCAGLCPGLLPPYPLVTAMPACEAIETIGCCIVNERVRLVLPTELESIDRAVAFLEQRVRQLGLPDPDRIHRITIPLHEAVTNAIIHGNLEVSSDLKEQESGEFSRAVARRSTDAAYASRTVEVVFDADVDRFQWMITDQGPGFDVAGQLARSDANDVSLLASGRGITMMRAFMDDVYYHQGGRSVILTMQRSQSASTCRLDDGRRMRELDRLLGTRSPRWNPSRELPPSEARPAGSPTHSRPLEDPFDAWLDPFLESLLQAAGGRSEQRQHQRIPFTAELSVRDASGVSVTAFARDLSRGGISFLCAGAFTSPDVTVTIPTPDGAVTLPGRIVRSTQLTPSVADFGVRFVPETLIPEND